MRLARARPYCGFESLNHLIFCEQKGGEGDVFVCDYDYPIQFYDMVRHKSPEKWEHVTSSFLPYNSFFYVCINRSFYNV